MSWRPRFGMMTLLFAPVYVGLGITWWTAPYTVEPEPIRRCADIAQQRYTEVRTLTGQRVMHGPCTSRLRGLITSGQYVLGREDGIWRTHDHLGRLRIEAIYESGSLMQRTEWFDDGRRQRLDRRVDGNLMTVEVWQEPNVRAYTGKKLLPSPLREDEWVEHGEWAWFDAEGNRRESITFDRGIPVVELNADERELARKGWTHISPKVCMRWESEECDSWPFLLECADVTVQGVQVEDDLEANPYPGLRTITAFILSLHQDGLEVWIRSPQGIEIAERTEAAN